MAVWEWQIANGSRQAHVIDTDKPAWLNPDGSRRRSGPRSLCGRYPQRNAESPWFALGVRVDGVLSALRHYRAWVCPECTEILERSEAS